MVQPYVPDAVETALVYLDGAYSHALRRAVPLPTSGEREVFYLEEELSPAAATDRQREVADAAVACAPGDLLYARVDLLGDEVLEVEATEPSLYLAFGDENAPARLASGIVKRLHR